METSTASQGNSSVKSDDSSPQNESGRGSPPPNCAICLGTCKNKSFTDSCLHQFCFKCLLTWSKVKAECPLCKQNFKSIIHNVRSNHQYEQYMVEQTHEDIERMDIDNFTTNVTRRFRYRTTLTLPRRDSVAIQQLLLQHYPMMADVLPAPAHRRRPSSYFRRTVYRHNLWARPLPDFTGRFRDCTPEFYRYNNSQMHRLMPWLNRELHYLLNENAGHISYVMTQIMDLLPRYHINSQEFREAVQRYFGDRTEHFLHELYCFASTPYDMAGYDRNVQYTTDSRISTMVNEVLSSSDTESSVDSDIVLVSRSMPAEAPPGPSRVPAPVYPQNFISEPAANNVIPIETISQSDSDDDSSEVMVIGYIKPPHARTPEVVDLLGSDSDVVIEDEPQPEQPQPTEVQENRPAPLVKLTLSQHDAQPAAESESEGSTYTPPLPLTRSHQWSDSSPTTESSTSSSKSQTTPNSSSNSSTLSYYSDSSSDSFNPLDRRTKKRNSKKSSSNTEKPKKKSKKNKSNTHKSKKVKTSSTQAKKTNNNNHRKSNSGKGVKTSKRTNSTTNAPSVLDQPGTSGTQSSSKSNRKRKIENKHVSRESKRLKSVVNVVNRYLRSSSSRESTQTSSSKLSTSNVSSNTNAITEESGATTSASANNLSDSSDSEYNLPLNLTVRILQSHK